MFLGVRHIKEEFIRKGKAEQVMPNGKTYGKMYGEMRIAIPHLFDAIAVQSDMMGNIGGIDWDTFKKDLMAWM